MIIVGRRMKTVILRNVLELRSIQRNGGFSSSAPVNDALHKSYLVCLTGTSHYRWVFRRESKFTEARQKVMQTILDCAKDFLTVFVESQLETREETAKRTSFQYKHLNFRTRLMDQLVGLR